MVQTGLLESEDGSSWFNLDTGEINIKNQLRFLNGQLTLNSAESIKTLPTGTQIKGGTTTIDNTKVRVNHGSTAEYSEMNALGFVRKWPHGEAKYLNSIYVANTTIGNNSTTSPSLVRVTLPGHFRGRGSDVDIVLTLNEFYLRHGILNSDYGDLRLFTERTELRLEVYSSNFDVATPYLDIYAYLVIDDVRVPGEVRRKFYEDIGFRVLIIGK